MAPGFLLRRLILPYVAILCALGILMALVALIAVRHSAGDVAKAAGLIFAALIVFTLVAVFATAALSYVYAKAHVQALADLSARIGGQQQPDSSGDLPTISAAMEKTAAAMRQVVARGAKDKAQLLTILSSMSDGLIATDHQQHIVLMNAAARELLATSGEVDGRPVWDVLNIERVRQAVWEVMLTGNAKTMDAGLLHQRRLEATVTRLPRLEQGGGVIIVLRDVTEATRYQELRKEFVANVSHELRTPLTVIRGFVETLQDGALDNRTKAIEYLGTIQRHSDQLTNLVNDLLDLSRLESGIEAAREPIDLVSVVRHVADLAAPSAARKKHHLSVVAPSELPTIHGNPHDVQQAIANLVENAIKYTPEGGEISLSAWAEPRELVVEVRDNGIGISADDLPRIFERFYRVDRSRSREMGGTGLGLSIVKHVMQVHGGTVEAQSRPSEGSRFTLRFPIRTTPVREA